MVPSEDTDDHDDPDDPDDLDDPDDPSLPGEPGAKSWGHPNDGQRRPAGRPWLLLAGENPSSSFSHQQAMDFNHEYRTQREML